MLNQTSNLQAVVHDFRETIQNAGERLSRISDEASSVKPDPGKWSQKEIIGHLIDSAANNHARFVRAQISDHLEFPGYEQEEWVATQRYNEEPWENLVALWKFYNLHLCHVISVASDKVTQKSHSKHSLDRIAFKAVNSDQPATLDYFMRDYIDHLHHHLKQIWQLEIRN